MNGRLAITAAFILSILTLPATGRADDPTPNQLEPAAPIAGTLFLSGGPELPASVRSRFVQLAGGPDARLVVLALEQDAGEDLLAPWRHADVRHVLLMAVPAAKSDSDDAAENPLDDATGVWLTARDVRGMLAACGDARLSKQLASVLARGGVIGADASSAPAVAKKVLDPDAAARLVPGFGLLDGVLIDPGFLSSERPKSLAGVLQAHPGAVGLGIGKEATLVVQGRAIVCLGDSLATFCLPPSSNRPACTEVLRPGGRADLVALSRAAIARTRAAFPPERPPEVEAPHGSLLIVGGGGLPREIRARFVELAGGPDKHFVVVPTASEPAGRRPGDVSWLAELGVEHVDVFHVASRAEANDEARLAALVDADAVWFAGGRQWRLVDAYLDTRAHELFNDVLRRGGVIGGSSAGATIQGDYLVRGHPLGNTVVIAEGYERGLGFLPGSAIDQHFSQRRRFADMAGLKRVYPQLLGLGIDEATAVVVRGNLLEVIGDNQVALFERASADDPDPARHLALRPGSRYDLRARRLVSETAQ